jgi:hypothetical protein
MANISGDIAKVSDSVVNAMASTPLAIALLLVNAAFLVFTAWVLGVVAKSTSERNKTQTAFMEALIKDCMDSQLRGSKTGYRIPDVSPTLEQIMLKASQ